jgi:hypothetical protein
MRKIVLYFLTSISAIWFIDILLSGFIFKGGTTTVFLVDIFILVAIYLTEWLAGKVGKKSDKLIFAVIGTFLTFFSLYFASLFIEDFYVGSGSLQELEIGFLSTPIIKGMDQILTLLLGSLIVILIALITKWSSEGKKSE